LAFEVAFRALPARASVKIRRMGEVLKQYDAQGKRTDQLDVGDDTKLSQREAAEEAGISKRQQVTAVRIANIPEDQFEIARRSGPIVGDRRERAPV
jgi:hypothetical protein